LSLDKYDLLIKKERGSSNINNIYLWLYIKKYSVPVSAFILTIIAVSVSTRKEGEEWG
jgi:lipopolysaccharide export system permease protein